MSKYLIEKEGLPREWVGSIEGYPGWTVVGEGAAFAPKEYGDYVGDVSVVNAARKTAVERRAKFMAMDREQLVDFILGIIAKGDARLDKDDARLDALETKVAAIIARLPAP